MPYVALHPRNLAKSWRDYLQKAITLIYRYAKAYLSEQLLETLDYNTVGSGFETQPLGVCLLFVLITLSSFLLGEIFSHIPHHSNGSIMVNDKWIF